MLCSSLKGAYLKTTHFIIHRNNNCKAQSYVKQNIYKFHQDLLCAPVGISASTLVYCNQECYFCEHPSLHCVSNEPRYSNSNMYKYNITQRKHTSFLNTLIMVALCNRGDYYIFALWFLSSFFFFPRLISAVWHWMSTILPHMVWP